MRLLVVLSVVCFAVLMLFGSASDAFALTSTGDGGWFWQNPLPHGNPITDIDFVDAQHGWAVSGWNRPYSTWWAVPRGGEVLHTNDGGRTWSVQYHSFWHLGSACFIDRWTGWIVGDDIAVRTTDGGRTWQRMATEGGDVDFVDERTGWIVGGARTYRPGERISRTTDGGATWARQFEVEDYEELGYGLEAVDFIDDRRGWAVGGLGRILHTDDGGATWVPQASATTATLHDVRFADADRGWAVGDGGTILATTDGGATWGPRDSGTVTDLFATDVVTQSAVFAAGADGALLASTDGGLTWAPRASGTAQTVRAMDFAGSLHGWLAAGARPVARDSGDEDEWPSDLLSTEDGGLTWSSVSSHATLAELTSVDFVSLETGWVVGAGGLQKSVDGGLSWTAQESAGTAVVDADFVDAEAGWLVDATGAVSKTIDGGESWTLALPGPTEAREVGFQDRLTGWAAGDRWLWSTEDGGVSWVCADLVPPWVPFRVERVTGRLILSGNEWWMATRTSFDEPASVYHTTDAGVTWAGHAVAYDRGDTYNVLLYDLDFFDADLGYAVGYLGGWQDVTSVVYRTSDGGLTWSRCSGAIGIHPLREVLMVDELTAWAVGDDGSLACTTDGGATWHGLASAVRPDLHGICSVDSTHGWIVGGDGTILHTVTGGKPDTTAPVTTRSGADEGWHNTDVAVRFAASDPDAPYSMGVASTEWSLDGGPWTEGEDVVVTAERDHSNDGVHVLAYRSRDKGGNLEATQSCTVRIDTRPPEAILPATQRVSDAFTVTVDDALSPTCTLEVRILKDGARGGGAHGKRGGRRQVAAYSVTVKCGPAAQQVPLPSGLHARPYLLVATATDLAGNAQVEPATGVLRVR